MVLDALQNYGTVYVVVYCVCSGGECTVHCEVMG